MMRGDDEDSSPEARRPGRFLVGLAYQTVSRDSRIDGLIANFQLGIYRLSVRDLPTTRRYAEMSTPADKPNSSSTSSLELVEEVLAQQEIKNPELAAKQSRLLEILKRSHSAKLPSESTSL